MNSISFNKKRSRCLVQLLAEFNSIYALLFLFIFTSCQRPERIVFPYENAEYAKLSAKAISPKKIPLVDSLIQEVRIVDFPVPSSYAVDANKLKSVEAHSQVHEIPENVIKLTINRNNLTKVPFEIGPFSDSSNFILDDHGDTIPTGVIVPVSGKEVLMNFDLPKPQESVHPRYKVDHSDNISYLDVNEGLYSSYVYSILKDAKENIWFGHRFGLSKYDGVTFVDYTDKLGFKLVWDAIKDRHDILWFGTNEGVFIYDGHHFRKLTKDQGLIDNDIWSLLEDRNGHIWIGTYKGVSKYDGENFVHITRNEGLIDEQVNVMLEDNNGAIWFGTQQGVSIYDGRQFISFKVEDGLSHHEVISLYNDSKGNIWIGTNGGGVNVYDGNGFTHFTDKEGLSSNAVRSISEDEYGNIWIATDGGGFNRYDGSTFTHFTEKEGLLANDLYVSMDDGQGNLWFGDNGGGVDKFRMVSFKHYTEAEGLSNSFIYSIIEDRNQNLWFGGDESGLTMYDGESFFHYDVKPGVNSISFQTSHMDASGNLWFGTWQDGVFVYDGEIFTNITKKEGLVDNTVSAIEVDQKGNIWLGTNSGLIKFDGSTFKYYTEEEGLIDNTVNAILEDRNGNIWVGTSGGLSCLEGEHFANYDPDVGFPQVLISFLLEDHLGNIWVGSRDEGLTVFSGQSFLSITEEEGLLQNAIGSMVEDEDHNIWVGTEKGLNLIIPNEKSGTSGSLSYKVLAYEAGDGLKGLDFLTNSGHIDENNRLWLGSGKGLTSLDLNSHSLSNDAPEIHLRRLDINETYIDFSDTATKSQLNVEYSGLMAYENFPLDFYLPFSQNHLTFYYSAIDWAAPHALKYSYILEGLNDSWSQISSETKADYRNIPAGDYTFRVRAQGRNLVWSDEAIFNFTVYPPWYQTSSAYVMYFLFLLVSGYSYTRWRTRKLQVQKNVLEKTVAQRTDDLQRSNDQLAEQKKEIELQAFELEKMNDLKSKFYSVVGHDLRSPLTKLFAVVFKIKRAVGNTNAEMQRALKEFDGLYRQFVELLDNVLDWGLMDSGSKRVTLKSELLNDLVDNVVQLYQTFAQDKYIDLAIDEDDHEDIVVNIDRGSIEIVLRNLISNAIKFTKEEGVITVKLFLSEHKAGFSVIDSGVGIPKDRLQGIFEIEEQKGTIGTKGEKGSGLGLKLAHDFVKMNHGEIEIESKVGQGTAISVFLPLGNALGAETLE